MAGHVDGYFSDIPGVIGFIRSGKLKPSASPSSRRHRCFQRSRPLNEMGLPASDADNWNA